jgi:hypothetical protein
MDKVQKYNSFNTNIPSSESYRNYLCCKHVEEGNDFNSNTPKQSHTFFFFTADQNSEEKEE